MNSKIYEALQYAIFSSLLLLSLLRCKYFLQYTVHKDPQFMLTE